MTARRFRRQAQRDLRKADLSRVQQSIEKTIAREKPKTFWQWIRSLFTKTRAEKSLEQIKRWRGL